MWQVFLSIADISPEDLLVMCSFIFSVSIVFLTMPRIHSSDIFFRQVLLLPRSSRAVRNCFLSGGTDVLVQMLQFYSLAGLCGIFVANLSVCHKYFLCVSW